MERKLACECGHEVRSNDVNDLVARAQRHAIEIHGMRFTREQILSLARPVLGGPERKR